MPEASFTEHHYCGVEQLVARLAHNQDSRGFESRPRYK